MSGRVSHDQLKLAQIMGKSGRHSPEALDRRPSFAGSDAYLMH